MNAVHPVFESVFQAFGMRAKRKTITKDWYENGVDLSNTNALHVEVVYDEKEEKAVEDVDVWVTNRKDNCAATVLTNIAHEIHATIEGKTYSLFDFLVMAADWKEVHNNSKDNL